MVTQITLMPLPLALLSGSHGHPMSHDGASEVPEPLAAPASSAPLTASEADNGIYQLEVDISV